MGSAKVKASEGGVWGMSLEYFGDVDPIIGEPAITSTVPLTMSLQLSFVICQLDGIPTPDGCSINEAPTPFTPFMDVGNFRIFNKPGFNCTGSSCSTVYQPGPGAVVSQVVWKADWLAGQHDRWVAVAGAPIFFDTSTYSYFTAGISPFRLIPVPGLMIGSISSLVGQSVIRIRGSIPHIRPMAGWCRMIRRCSRMCPSVISDAKNLQVNINVDRQMGEASTSLTREVLTSPAGLETFSFNLSWEVPAEGYTFIANKNLAPVSVPNDSQVASLTLLFGSVWDMDFVQNPETSRMELYQPAQYPRQLR